MGRFLLGNAAALALGTGLAFGGAVVQEPTPTSPERRMGSDPNEETSRGLTPLFPPAVDWQASSWRYYLTFRPPRYVPPVTDARGRTLEYLDYARGWHINTMAGRVTTPEAPPDWTKPTFDDSAWPLIRGPVTAGTSWYDPVVRVWSLRVRFEAPDPAAVQTLALELEYIGGAMVYLNGVEVARGHLPAGALTGDTLAAGYPTEAYEWGLPINNRGYPVDPGEWVAPSEEAARWRRMTVAPDAKLLRKGENVLAVAIYQSGFNPYARQWVYHNMGGYKMGPWQHLGIKTLRLTVPPGKGDGSLLPERPFRVLSTRGSRPLFQGEDLQVWTEDIHRQLVSRDAPPSSSSPSVLRLVGARNGTYSAQVVVSTPPPPERRMGSDPNERTSRGQSPFSAPAAGLSATTSDLTQVGGAGRIPATAVSVRYGQARPFEEMGVWLREGGGWQEAPPMARAISVYIPEARTRQERIAASKNLYYFDHLTAAPPNAPATDLRPIWVTVAIPKDAPPGEYRGTLSVTAAHDRQGRSVPIRLRVMDWTLPDPKDYASFVGIQHSIWRLVEQYCVAPWSEEHWRLIERTMAWLAQAGNDLAALPLTYGGESGSAESIVAWIKTPDGYDYDWTNLDRYLGLVAKHWGTKCAIVGEVCWVPFRGGKESWPVICPGVTALADGKRTDLPLAAAGSDEWKAMFLPFAKALAARVKEKGFQDLYWGWFYDGVPDGLRAMAEALATAVPHVQWARASHNGNSRKPFPKDSPAQVALDMHIRGFPQPFERQTGEPASRLGWQSPGNVLFPRVASEVQALGRWDGPMAHRWIAENCLVNGAAGFARLGADFWPPHEFNNWYSPFVTHLLYPGPDGAEASVRFEALREGVQEAEVRIRLEQARKDQVEPAKSILADRVRRIGALPAGADYTALGDYYAGWQERSWDLYAAAAAAFGGTPPAAEDKARFFALPRE